MSITGTATAKAKVGAHTNPRPSVGNGLAAPQLPVDNVTLAPQTPDQFQKRVKEKFPGLVIADDEQAQWRGMEALEILRLQGIEIPPILGESAQRRGSTQAELALKMKELARSNEELEQFANVASHDLQEPLRMVSTYTQLLGEQYSGKLDAKADRYIHYAADGAQRMGTLIRDLLQLSRVGRTETGRQSIDSGEVVKQVVHSLQAAIVETGAVVTCGPLPVVMARDVELSQLFQNLIGNAIKFHDGKPPEIQVSAK